MINWIKTHKHITLYILGIFVVAVSIVPYFILKENIWVTFHDQLDGEVLNYIYQAKYFFNGDVVPEMMNGIPKTGMLMPAPMGVIFFLLLSPFWAYVSLQILVIFTAYTGMFLLLNKITGDCRIGFVCGCLFAYLPFMPVYGLSIAGLPLLWYAFLMLYEKDKMIISYLLIVFTTGFSSFVLSGFAVCLMMFVVLAYIIRRNGIKKHLHMIIGFGVMCVTFVLCNLSLFADFIPGINSSKEVSHRTEFILYPVSDYVGEFKTVFFGESMYTPAYGGVICGFTVILIILCLVFKKKDMIRMPLAMLTFLLVITVLSILWKSSLCLNTIRQLGPLKYFQANRISWLVPPLWYILLGVDFKIVLQWLSSGQEKMKNKMIWVIGYGSALLVCALMALIICKQSFLNRHIRQILFPDTYDIITWNQYYAGDVFEQIDEIIDRDKSEYRVVSLGMSPAAALYNGFYCLDGYSNNYPLSYKHEFKAVIENELEKSEENRIYFDEWGNRCYLMSSESGGSPMIRKYAATAYQDLDIDVNQLSSMGCEYIFSAMEILNADDLGLMSGGVYETPASYYRVHVYSIR